MPVNHASKIELVNNEHLEKNINSRESNSFKLRSEKSEVIIRKAWDEAQGAWEETGMAPDER